MAYFGNGHINLGGQHQLPQGQYNNLGASAGTATVWGTIVFSAVTAAFVAPTIFDTLVKTKILGFKNKLNTKEQIARSAALGAVIALPFAAAYGGIAYTIVREA